MSEFGDRLVDQDRFVQLTTDRFEPVHCRGSKVVITKSSTGIWYIKGEPMFTIAHDDYELSMDERDLYRLLLQDIDAEER